MALVGDRVTSNSKIIILHSSSSPLETEIGVLLCVNFLTVSLLYIMVYYSNLIIIILLNITDVIVMM